MNITIVGTGYVGLVAGACFAEHGNIVVCVDVDHTKVAALKRGEIPIYEPGLEDLVERNSRAGRLTFTTSLKDGVQASEIIFIAVGTPQDEDGSADLRYVLQVAEGIGSYMNGSKIVVDKSTVPVGTGAKVKATILSRTSFPVEIVSNPEFLKEGAAIDDFMRPDRVVVGVESERCAEIMRELYAPFVRTNNPILVMDVVSAEMTKYAANTMLAVRVSFMNEIANLCEQVGANVDNVRLGMGTDKRIGTSFLFPGIGYGGSCFPKDVQALIRTGHDLGIDLAIAKAAETVNSAQKQKIIEKVVGYYDSNDLAGKIFAVWGLAFKPRTDDTREAPALSVCKGLLNLGAKLVCYDPEANESFSKRLGEHERIQYVASRDEALVSADALIICTEWNEFRKPNYTQMIELMRNLVIFDGRNILSPSEVASHGITHISIGRPPKIANVIKNRPRH
jgi:UDPglucose 6-dehydrogenase